MNLWRLYQRKNSTWKLVGFRIREGASCFQDMYVGCWTESDTDPLFQTDGKVDQSGTIVVRAFGYGLHGSASSYGDGAIFLKSKDIYPVFAKETDHAD